MERNRGSRVLRFRVREDSAKLHVLLSVQWWLILCARLAGLENAYRAGETISDRVWEEGVSTCSQFVNWQTQ